MLKATVNVYSRKLVSSPNPSAPWLSKTAPYHSTAARAAKPAKLITPVKTATSLAR